MKKFFVCAFGALLVAGCTPEPAPIVEEQATSSVGLLVVALQEKGFIYQDDTLGDAWFLKAEHDGPIIDLSFQTMKECVREATGKPCTAQDLIEGMEMRLSGSGTIDTNLGRTYMNVVSARIIGTSLTFSEVGEVSRASNGKWNITYTQKGTTKTMPISLSATTVCSDGGEKKPCTSWMNKRGGAVYGEIRTGENIIRATWIDLP
jgi:hypothetical protein